MQHRTAKLILSVALVCALVPHYAWATPSERETETKTITWTSLEEQPSFDETITINGIVYELAETPVIKEVNTDTARVPADHTIIRECWPDDLDATIASFPETYTSENEEYAGDIPRTNISYEAVYATRTWEVNANQSITNLPTNDVSQLQTSVSYTNPETGNTLSLALASVSWEVVKRDANGLPLAYNAACIYRGTDSADVVDHYVVTASYEGEIPSKTPVITYEAKLTYSATTPAAPATPSPDFSWLWALLGGAAAVAASVTCVFVFMWRSKDVRIGIKMPNSFKVLARAKSKRRPDASLEVELPATIDASRAGLCLLLRKNKADGGLLRITQCGRLIATSFALEYVEINKAETAAV